MSKEKNLNYESMLEEIGQIILDNKKFNEYKNNKDGLSLMLAIESLIKSDVNNYSQEDILGRVEVIEEFYDLDNPNVISDNISGKKFFIFNHVKNLTI